MHAREEQLEAKLVVGGSAIRSATFGDMEAAINAVEAGADFAPVFEAAFAEHGGRCPVPHWGYVIEGELVVGYGEGREERYQAGEVFYMEPGHSARTERGVRTVDFSPAAPMSEFVTRLRTVLDGLAR